MNEKLKLIFFKVINLSTSKSGNEDIGTWCMIKSYIFDCQIVILLHQNLLRSDWVGKEYVFYPPFLHRELKYMAGLTWLNHV